VEAKEGDWSLLKNHIRDVLADGNEEHFRYILNWSAYAVQNPDKPAETALVFMSGRGTGKGFYARAMGKLFGHHYMPINSMIHLTGRFNAHLRDCCLLFADEAYWPGDKIGEGTLKALVTEPVIPVEGKYQNAVKVKNMLKIIMATNEGWAVPAGADERRFAVFRPSEHKKQQRSYFDPIREQLEAGGYEAMLYELQTMELNGWRPYENIPQTEALLAQKIKSLDPIDEWLFSLCCHGALPSVNEKPRLARFADLRDHAHRSSPKKMAYVTDRALAEALKDFGARQQSTKVDGSRAYLFPPLSEARARWEEKLPGLTWDFDHAEWGKDDL
jgi:hypothetical protein